MKVLIIFEWIPEDTKIYLLNIEGEDLEKVKRAYGLYVNFGKNWDPADWLEEFLANKEPLKIEVGKPFEVESELVVHSGFGM